MQTTACKWGEKSIAVHSCTLRCVCCVSLGGGLVLLCAPALKVYRYNAELAIICVSQECVFAYGLCERALMRVCLCRMLGRSFGKSGSMCYCVRCYANMHAHG